MDEKKIWQELDDSAEDIKVPESLNPEKIEAILIEKKREQQRSRFRRAGHYIAIASACLVVLGGVLVIGRIGLGNGSKKSEHMYSQTTMDSEAAMDSKAAMESEAGNAEVSTNCINNPYIQAADYGDVFDAIKKVQNTYDKGYDLNEEAVEDAAPADGSSGAKSSGSIQHSNTNVQTENVDEGDFVKTDGSYLYVVDGEEIKIIDIQNEKFELITTLRPGRGWYGKHKSVENIYELYADGDMLQIVCGSREADLVTIEDFDAYQIGQKSKVYLYTYDISDRKKPELKGVVEQDGDYRSSRKTDGYVYLFTRTLLSAPDKRNEAIQEDGVKDWLPSINNKTFAPEDILITDNGGSYAIMVSSIAAKKPGKVQDSKMLIVGEATEYVSDSNIYLYENVYNDGERTSIAKFSYDTGEITPAAGGIVDGSIRDTFAINEKDGYLRVLTTIYEAGWTNQVSVLDENMNLCGKVDGLAPEEEIYSARFLGDYGYFVTYRNTDPLFSVDFSEPENPKIIGELKVTGFSDYLHIWAGDQLLGIGFETDPETGQQKGVKLSMFNISDPENVKEENRAIMPELYSTPATEDYKSVLIDQEKNLIGFPVSCIGADRSRYFIYSYSPEGGFEKVFSEDTDVPLLDNKVRGVYAGDIFYLVTDRSIISYDMVHNFERLYKLDI